MVPTIMIIIIINIDTAALMPINLWVLQFPYENNDFRNRAKTIVAFLINNNHYITDCLIFSS